MEKPKEMFRFPESFDVSDDNLDKDGTTPSPLDNPSTTPSFFVRNDEEKEKTESANEKDRKTEPPPVKRGRSLLSFISDELERDYLLEQNEKKLKERRKRVYTFFKTPQHLEKFLFFGFLLCFDVFLFIFTFLPIRIIIGLLRGLRNIFKRNGRKILNPVQKVDLLKGIILVVVSLFMQSIDTSVIYHVVRVQSVIKLYVVYNMLDMADKLLASFGQDVLDALFWTATEPRDRRREHIGIIPHLLLSFAYVSAHVLLNLSQAIVLNVAINSFSKALLTIMISNQFIEIKSSVFKRFEKNNLFQMSCSDARERLHYSIILLVVALRNFAEYEWNIEYAYSSFFPFAALVIGSEFLVDWFKHAFITKFNNIQPDIYLTYRKFLAKNILSSRDDLVFTGHTDQVSRRMGFTALPLAILLIKVVGQCVSLNGINGLCFAFSGYLCLCALKLLVSITVFGKASEYIKDDVTPVLDANTVRSPNDPTESNDKIFKQSWSFEPLNSVQDIYGGFNSNTKIFTGR
ncbi:transmembrane anterior posterior transformation protein 1 homolog [Clytia hemisphaerica]|uniref:Uncharacterized protein n=1 Tax=Clytia hemisphaerica TaxID=252671 RepID=A0A7M5XPJ1_9CNID|eukprot:TCONS_00001309-protein